jgi:hypothetical protein
MNECKAGVYKNNTIVTHAALMCWGGFGQPPCQYLEECAKENNLKKRKKK